MIAVSAPVSADETQQAAPTSTSPDGEPEPPATTVPTEDPAPTETTVPPTTTPTTTGPPKAPTGATRIETVPGATLPETPAFPATASGERAVITEIMLNPVAVYDSRGEWFEIHNPTAETLDLAGWTFGDETHDLHTIDALKIAAGGYAVLARHGDTARNGGVTAAYDYGDSMLLYNPGDRIILRDAAGALVDDVDYSLPDFTRPGGRSLSLIEPTLDNALAASWCLSTTAMSGGDLASPGRVNQCSESLATVVISEILNNPQATSDFAGEWFELHNDGDEPVDLTGFKVQDDDGESFLIDTSLVVEPGGYAVLGITADPALNGDVDVDFAYGARLRLHNSFDELVLLDAEGVQVDAVRWDDGRTFPDPNGASMTLRVPGVDNSDGRNWCESTTRWHAGDLGSPGTVGDCEPQTLPDVVITEVMFDPEQTSSERQGEWFEIANVGLEPAVLDGFVLRTAATAHTITTLTIDPGARAVLAVNGDTTENGGLDPDYVYGTDLPLYNTISTLEIEAPDGTKLDNVRWSTDAGFPKEPGHSIELRAADVPNELGANWCLATLRYGEGDFGTPGSAPDCLIRPKPIPLLISEVMRNPAAVTDTYGEWFEIYNPTADPVDLHNWSVSDLGSEFHVIAASVVVPAEGHVVIGRSNDRSRNGDLKVDYATGGAMVLINAGDEIVLSDQYGQLIDEVAWSNDNLMPRPNGGSMARTEAAMASFASNLDVSQWCVTATQFGAGDRGTPGAANDCAQAPHHAVVINEIHRDPKATADAKGEWVELHNSGPDPIDISGWTMRDDDFDSFRFDPDTTLVIGPGEFLTLGRNTEALNGGVEIDVQYGTEFIHYNTTDEIMLLDRDYTPVDRVAWTSSNGFPKVSGAAMALTDPTLDNAVGANWCAAVTDQGNGDLGTPGAANVCELEPGPPTTLPTAMTHSVFSLADPTCGGTTIAGSKITLADAVRSNGHFKAAGSKVTLHGQVSHGGEVSIVSKASTLGGVVHVPAPQPLPFGWDIDDFRPGGARALAAGTAYYVHDGDWKTDNAGSIKAGVHFVEGDVVIVGKEIKLNEVTIVATGSITISGKAIDLRSHAADLPVLFSAAAGCNVTGIDLSASSFKWSGAMFAPMAHVEVGASVIKTSNGAIVGGTMLLEASKVDIEIA